MKRLNKVLGLMAMSAGLLAAPAVAKADSLQISYSTGVPIQRIVYAGPGYRRVVSHVVYQPYYTHAGYWGRPVYAKTGYHRGWNKKHHHRGRGHGRPNRRHGGRHR